MTIVTVDGPMASGKTSVSCLLSKKLHWKWISTGVFYRGLAYIAQLQSLNLENENRLVELISSSHWRVKMAEDKTKFLYKDEDITERIYDEDIGQISSYISAYPKVRESLIQTQRSCAKKAGTEGIIFEGRDCGTVIFPEAQIKFYLTAFRDDRIKRRLLEEKKREKERLGKEKEKKKGKKKEEGEDVRIGTLSDIKAHEESIYFRDIRDSHREQAPLRIPRQAYFVNSSEMALHEVVNYFYGIISQYLNRKSSNKESSIK